MRILRSVFHSTAQHQAILLTGVCQQAAELDGFCGENEVSAAYKRVANLAAKDKKQKELRRQYCLDGGAVVKPREALRQFYEENYTHQEQFRSAWETLNRAKEKSWADRQKYEQAKADYLS